MSDTGAEERTVDKLKSLLRENWAREGYSDEKEERNFGLEALSILEQYYYKIDPSEMAIFTNKSVELKLGRYTFKTRIDCLSKNFSDKYIITHYKTANYIEPFDIFKDLKIIISILYVYYNYEQLPLYRIIYLKHLEIQEQLPDQQLIENIYTFLDKLVTDIQNDEVYETKKGRQCKFCKYNLKCLQEYDKNFLDQHSFWFILKNMQNLNKCGLNQNAIVTVIDNLFSELQYKDLYILLKDDMEKYQLVLGDPEDYKEFAENCYELIDNTFTYNQRNIKTEKDTYSFFLPISTQNDIYGEVIVTREAPLKENLLIVIDTLLQQFAEKIKLMFFYNTSVTDGLTKLFNVYYFREELYKELIRCKKYGIQSAVILLDIDFFKKFNDTYGHQAGDFVLKEIAVVLRESVRPSDLVSRYGGEEFVVILPDITIEDSIMAGERIRKGAEEHVVFWEGQKLHINISAGIGILDNSIKHIEEVIKKADDALYMAKESGRNRVILYEEKENKIQDMPF